MAAKKKTAQSTTTLSGEDSPGTAKYPRHTAERAMRIARAIIEQNAGRPCTAEQAAQFVKVGNTGPFRLEISSSLKFGFLTRTDDGKLQPTDRAKSIVRPQKDGDDRNAYRAAVIAAPQLGDVYKHYRGENLPDDTFFKNTVIDTYRIPSDKADEFKQIFMSSLETASLLAKHGDKVRVLDVSDDSASLDEKSDLTKKLSRSVKVDAADTCFVMQPFAAPLGDYYEKIYKPAIEKAGLTPVRADAEIFGTGKIIDQVWRGINAARVLVAELTTRNANVFYELGLAHALRKPVVPVSANEERVSGFLCTRRRRSSVVNASLEVDRKL